MKVLILSDAQSTHTKRWVYGLKSEGVEVILFSIKPAEDDFFETAGVKSFYFDLFTYKRSGNPLKGISRHYQAVKYLKEVLRAEKPDILHAHYLTSYSLIAALSGYKPLYVSMWGSDIYLFPNKSIINRLSVKYILSKADRILSTSRVMAVEAGQYTSKNISVTPFGVDTELFHKTDYSTIREGFTVGIVKTLSPNYGVDVLIDAFNIVCEANSSLPLKLIIVGKGPDREKLEKLVEDLSLREKVQFLGFVENSLLPPLFNKFDVSVYPSNSESFGVSALESMACGCPVVTSDADGFKEIVDDGVDGFIVPKADPMAFAAAIQRFIDEPNLREKMGASAIEKVKQCYSWKYSLEKMISIYNERA